MKKAEYIISRILKIGTLLSSIALIGTVLLQIFARFALPSAPSWTEEASRFFFMYAICFAAGLAIKTRYYVYLDILSRRLSARGQRLLISGIAFIVCALFLVFSFYAISFTMQGHAEHSPSLGLPMSLAFGSMIVMGASISFFSFIQFRKSLK